MARLGPTVWKARARSSAPITKAATPAAWPKPSKSGATMIAGAATVSIAACSGRGIVVRALVMGTSQRYERMCDLCVTAVTHGPSRISPPSKQAPGRLSLASKRVSSARAAASSPGSRWKAGYETELRLGRSLLGTRLGATPLPSQSLCWSGCLLLAETLPTKLDLEAQSVRLAGTPPACAIPNCLVRLFLAAFYLAGLPPAE